MRRKESERGEVKAQREQEGQRTMGDGSEEKGQGGMKRAAAGDERAQRQFQEGIKRKWRDIVERGIQHGSKRRSEEAGEIQQQEDVLGKTRRRVRRQVLDAVLVPCKTGQLCIISGQFMKIMFKACDNDITCSLKKYSNAHFVCRKH